MALSFVPSTKYLETIFQAEDDRYSIILEQGFHFLLELLSGALL